MAEIKVPMGPQHPALKEPESFNLILEGERIVDAEVKLGYNHRGIEKACESRSYIQSLYLTERVCGICSHTHSTAFIQAVEEIAKVEVPPRGQFIRGIIGELERVHSHLLWLGVAGHEVGFDTLFMYAWRDRELVMDLLALLSGNRVNYGINTVGGVRRDIDSEQTQQALKTLEQLTARTEYYIKVVTEEPTFIGRLLGVGKLSKEDAELYGAVGPTARGSGVSRDTRKDDPYGVYQHIQFNVITDQHADVLGRSIVRVFELLESYKMLKEMFEKLPEGPIAVKVPRKIPAGEAVSRNEAPRGENIHYVRSNGSEIPERVKIRAATLANLPSIRHMLRGGYLADFPIVIAAIDPCFSCTDRAIKVVQGKKSEIMDWGQLREYGINWYKKHRGIDLSRHQ
ncbi:NADH-quinone oxidoreductase subunit D [Hydrogenispora ethanolica]|jgi:NADH-quinone oxidoreductase subunit D|uniref:NADH-quinone oxidoreductase subunit D n=1 Tax=Hydrogenispora ethanolica TaxID=1082276 RepID=A0A4V2QCN0_HYDET|nr:nickel-dependent hydrogenase large subunit [Hydrogenispora ethanolica]TCL60887.1 NADH-quinone oxidoreductase subunit D [Hydrogenispora ethanolica]